MAMAVGHGHWPLPLAMATGHGYWPWLAMVGLAGHPEDIWTREKATQGKVEWDYDCNKMNGRLYV